MSCWLGCIRNYDSARCVGTVFALCVSSGEKFLWSLKGCEIGAGAEGAVLLLTEGCLKTSLGGIS